MSPQASESIKLCVPDLSVSSEMIKNKSDTLENNINNACIRNSIRINLTNFQILNINNENNTNSETGDNTMEVFNKQHEMYTGNQIDDTTRHAVIIREKCNSYRPHYFDDSLVSKSLTDIEEKDYNSEDKESIVIDKSIDFFKKYDKEKLNKMVVNKDECSSTNLRNIRDIDLLYTKKVSLSPIYFCFIILKVFSITI